MKTNFAKILESNKGLLIKLYKCYDIAPRTTTKALYIDDTLTFKSKEKIYDALIDLNLIKENEISLFWLFSKYEWN